MPYKDRHGYRQRPLGDGADVQTFPVSDESAIAVYARSGYKLFIEAMWHGDYQQVPVDPEEAEDLIEALQHALAYLSESKQAPA